VQAIMEDQGVWEVVEPSGEADAAAEDQAAAAARTAKDRKARAHLLQCLPDDLLMQWRRRRRGSRSGSVSRSGVGADRVKEARL